MKQLRVHPDLALGHKERRLRRLRTSPSVRALVEETTLRKDDLIAPLFVSEIDATHKPIASLPGVSRVPLAALAAEVQALEALGLKAVMLFPVVDPSKKNPEGTESANPEGLIQRAVRIVKEACPALTVFADVALDPFTSHGHDGVLAEDGEILNDETVEALCHMSISLAMAGVDFVSPSDMMDGRIGAIRAALDAQGFHNTGILAYSAKFASAFYGPFREAIASGARGLDKKSYQLSPGNRRQALLEARFDEDEGADMLMVKPALCYLDIVRQVRDQSLLPIVAYHVSGEYAMLKAAAQNHWIDEKPAVWETLLSIKRAGACLIVTYYARWFAEQFPEN